MKMVLKFCFLTCALLLGIWDCAAAQCNGDFALCNKRFDEVCYVTTHNAFNYPPNFLPNQSNNLATQLQDGVRCLMLDVYWYNNAPTCYHGNAFLGNTPLSDLLGDIKTFLDANPNEVMSIIFECYITAAQMNDVFTQAGLLPYLHVQAQGSPWPLLSDMISSNERLVVFTDVNDGQAYPWYHYVWNYAVETDYTAHSRSDFSCNYNRGDSTKSLFILNHMVTAQTIGTGILDSALAVNSNPYLIDRAMQCWNATGKRPNFLTVDFYEQGNVMAARDSINHLSAPVAVDVPLPSPTWVHVSPNPVHDAFYLDWQGKWLGEYVFQVYDLQGNMVMQERLTTDVKRIALPSNIMDGLYVWHITGEKSPSKFAAIHGKVYVLRG